EITATDGRSGGEITVEDVGKRVDGAPHVRVTQEERRQPETQDLQLTEVADDPTSDQRLHDRAAFGVADAHLAAALAGAARGEQRQRVVVAAGFDQVDEQVR